MPFWDERFKAFSDEYPDVRTGKYHIDILAAQFVARPDRFDVVVGSNLFGDTLTDLDRRSRARSGWRRRPT